MLPQNRDGTAAARRRYRKTVMTQRPRENVTASRGDQAPAKDDPTPIHPPQPMPAVSFVYHTLEIISYQVY
ncbi:MAG: hypothetical protein IKF61_08485, partial [Firmicutes bacterium]|nr:hypothetical protein [Bacillota bacterium]